MHVLLDLYTDYLLSSFGQTTATGLSSILDGAVFHDKITRLLQENDFDSKQLWKEVKPLIHEFKGEKGFLTFDDSLLEKPYTDENEIIGWFFDHNEKRHKKGINLLTAFTMLPNKGLNYPFECPWLLNVFEKTSVLSILKQGRLNEHHP